MLATATGNCAVTNETYNENKYYVVTSTVYLKSSMYLRQRQWLRLIAVMYHQGPSLWGDIISFVPPNILW